MKIVFDSGSTKTACAVVRPDGTDAGYITLPHGYNAMTARAGELHALVMSHTSLSTLGGEVRRIWFYGAGCATPEACARAEADLTAAFPSARVSVHSDMLGAARSLCGRSPGVACILGTGANSCLWDGCRMVANVPPLGYILGDEGSGAVMGRVFIEHLFKGLFPSQVVERFASRYGMGVGDVVTRVYRGERPNAFLASFAPFIREEADRCPEVRNMVRGEFERFLRFNVERYDGAQALPVSFLGSVAWHFSDILSEALEGRGLHKGHIARNPLPGMVEWIAENDD